MRVCWKQGSTAPREMRFSDWEEVPANKAANQANKVGSSGFILTVDPDLSARDAIFYAPF